MDHPFYARNIDPNTDSQMKAAKMGEKEEIVRVTATPASGSTAEKQEAGDIRR